MNPLRPPSSDIPVPLGVSPTESSLTHIPSKVACGFPSPAADYTEASLDLNRYLIHNRASSFFFTVVGSSMEGVGIMDSDQILVDRSIDPRHGHIVLAVIDDAFTVKRLIMRSGSVELRAENPNFPPIVLKDGQELQVWGVVTGLVRKFLP